MSRADDTGKTEGTKFIALHKMSPSIYIRIFLKERLFHKLSFHL